MNFSPLPRLHRVLGLAALVTLAVAPGAQAIPLIGVGASAGGYLGAMSGSRQGFAVDVDGNAQALGLDVAGNILGLPGQNGSTMLEVGVRKEVSFIPMLSIKPTLAYQGQNLLTSNAAWDNGLQARLDLGFSPILSPIWFEGNVGVGYQLATGALSEYAIGGYFAFLPIASVGVRYRALQSLSGTPNLSAVEAGLRLTI